MPDHGKQYTLTMDDLQEPEMRRWPHPIPPCIQTAPSESMLHYIHCALAYQNQTLSEIKALLEQIATEQER